MRAGGGAAAAAGLLGALAAAAAKLAVWPGGEAAGGWVRKEEIGARRSLPWHALSDPEKNIPNLAARAASCQLCWLGVCLQCCHVDNLCESPAAILLLGRCLSDHNSLQLHLFGHPGQASLRGDMDTSVVDRPVHDTLRPCAAAHSCPPAGMAASREEGSMMIGKKHNAVPPLALSWAASGHRPADLCSPAELAKSHWSHLSRQAGGGVVAVTDWEGAGPL